MGAIFMTQMLNEPPLGTRVLIVDDEELICWSLKQRLVDEGYISYTAGTKEEAKVLVEKHRFTHLITDLKLIECTGFDIIDMVREKLPDIHVVMLTAFGGEANRIKAEQKGVELFQIKPIQFEETLEYLHATAH